MWWNKRPNKKSTKCCEIHYIKAMKTHCVGCKKNNASENLSIRKTKQKILMLLSSCAVCSKKKSNFIKIQELY